MHTVKHPRRLGIFHPDIKPHEDNIKIDNSSTQHTTQAAPKTLQQTHNAQEIGILQATERMTRNEQVQEVQQLSNL
jgi:hypothetical protein